MQLVLEQTVRCTDGPFGALTDLVVDPASRRVTHLVVRPEGQRTGARLVPLARVDPAAVPEIALRCSRADVDAMDAVDEVEFVGPPDAAPDDPDWDVGVSDMVVLPSSDALDGLGVVQFDPGQEAMIEYDRVPKGDVELRRSSQVTSSDGHVVGRVDGVVVDGQGLIREVVLARGHLWGRHDVGIAVDAVERIETDAVVLRVAKDALGRAAPRRPPIG